MNTLPVPEENSAVDPETLALQLQADIDALMANPDFKRGYENGHPLEKGEVAAIHVIEITKKAFELFKKPLPGPDELRKLAEAERQTRPEATNLAEKVIGRQEIATPMRRLLASGCLKPRWDGWIVIDSTVAEEAARLCQQVTALAPEADRKLPHGVTLRGQIGVIGGASIGIVFLWDVDNKMSIGLMLGGTFAQFGAILSAEYMRIKEPHTDLFYGKRQLGLLASISAGVGVSGVLGLNYWSLGLGVGVNAQIGAILSRVWKLA